MKRGLLLLSCSAALTLSAQSLRMVQTNASDTVADVVDVATNEVILRIPNLDHAHGVAFSADGRTAYFTLEGNSTVVSVDMKTGKTLGSVALTGHPNNISASNDGKYVFAGINVAPGSMDIIDTATMKIVKTVPALGPVHNTYVTPDGKFALASSVAGSSITAYTIPGFEKAWEMKTDLGVRPMAFEKAADGSTSKMYIQLSNYHGFAVIDFKTRKELQRIEFPKDVPQTGQSKALAAAHGIGVTPDQKTLVANSSLAEGIFLYSLPDLKYQGFVKTGKWPDWVAITPDSKTAYIANSGDNNVSVVDLAARKVVTTIKSGDDPKRNAVVLVK